MTNRKRKRKNTTVVSRYRFRQKVHSRTAQYALAMAGLMLLWFAFFAGLASVTGGLSAYFGSAGVLAMVGSLVSLILAAKSRFEDNVLMLYPNLAIAASLTACICWIGTYWMGFVL